MKVSTGLSRLSKTRKVSNCRSQSPYPPAYVAPQRSGESRSLQDCNVQTSLNQVDYKTLSAYHSANFLHL
ncbi:unnamed protein product [Brassica rapa subsp. trilocularis]